MAARTTLSKLLRTQSFQQHNGFLARRSCSLCCTRRVVEPQFSVMKSSTGQVLKRRNFATDDFKIKETQEPDVLYRAIDVYIKGHEDAVLESYAKFAEMAANELGIKVVGILKPKMILDRVTLLRSVFVHKKHRIQYEAQTHKRVIQLKYLTGSTADAYLSYLQINIPAGVAMHVHKWAIEKLPRHLEEAMEEKQDQITSEDEAYAEEFRAKMTGDKTTTNADYEEYHTTKPYLIGTHG